MPKRLRFFLNLRPGLPGEVSSIFARAIELHLRKKDRPGAPAQMHFIQRAGSAMNLHVQFAGPAIRQDLLFKQQPA